MGSGRIVVEAEARPLRRVLSATAWVVLEEVALCAEPGGDGRLLAATSARQVADGLAIDAGTAAGALRQLRRRGIVALERQPGPGSACRSTRSPRHPGWSCSTHVGLFHTWRSPTWRLPWRRCGRQAATRCLTVRPSTSGGQTRERRGFGLPGGGGRCLCFFLSGPLGVERR